MADTVEFFHRPRNWWELARIGFVLAVLVGAGATSRGFATATSLSGGGSGSPDDRPNILFIMADDHTTQAFGVYGSRLAGLDPTPRLDRLAEDGVRLTNAFVTNSICVPSRATLMTGQYSVRHGLRTLSGELSADQQYLPRLMGEAGYQTAIIGKWHLGAEPEAFDHYAVLPGQGSYHNPILRIKGEGEWPDNTRRFSAYSNRHSSDVVTDLAIDWLDRRDDSEPFFLMHHFKAPHGVWENAERFDFLYDDVQIPEPQSLWHQPLYGSAATRPSDIGTSISKRNERRNMGHHMHVDPSLDSMRYTRTAYQRYLKKYLRTVRGIDENVGRLLDHLREQGELDETIIVYTSDQGMMLGEHDYIDKRWMYEESMRVPFFVRYPAWFESGTTADQVVNNVDFAPTLLEMAGAEVPKFMQGESFLPALRGDSQDEGSSATYYRYWMHMTHHDVPAHYGIRTRRYKLIFFYGLPLDARGALEQTTQPAWELYDLKRDPAEIHNVYGHPAYREVQARLKERLLERKKEIGDTDESYPRLMEVRDRYWDTAGDSVSR